MVDINSAGQLLLRLGGWKLLLYADDRSAKKNLQLFSGKFSPFLSNISNSEEAIDRLFITNSLGFESSDYLNWWPVCELRIWEKFYETVKVTYKNFYSPFPRWQFFESEYNDSLRFFWSSLGEKNEEERRLIAMVVDKVDEFSHFTIFGGTLFLANQWHINRGGVCLHSAAVARRNDGFLFLGTSEAGKTTVSKISTSIGYPALGDDLNFIVKINGSENRYYLAAAPSPITSPVEYSSLTPPLKGVFILVQDKRDALTPLQPIQLARALFKEFFQETPYSRSLPDKLLRIGFQNCCDIARHVPGFELHFRKSPDFWKLIDEQFPD